MYEYSAKLLRPRGFCPQRSQSKSTSSIIRPREIVDARKFVCKRMNDVLWEILLVHTALFALWPTPAVRLLYISKYALYSEHNLRCLTDAHDLVRPRSPDPGND